MAVHLHVHFRDAYDPKEPRDEGGKWTEGGSRAKGKEAGFAPVEKSASGKFTLPGGGKLPAHIAKLRIPPAWTGVRYNPDPRGALLVSGRDTKDRRVALYAERFAKSQAALKFKRIQQLEPKFDRIIEKNTQAMRSRDPQKREAAAVLGLIMHTGIRPGSEQDTGAEQQAYGATTLEGRHVVSDKDGNVTLKFVGKKGVELAIPVSDPAIAADLKRRAKANGTDGQLFPEANARQLLSHVKSLAGQNFKTKDFRTLIGTKLAIAEIQKQTVPKSPTAYKKAALAVARKVAEALGNTPAIALKSYIAPHVFADWHLASEGKQAA
jgi:DNA topoisomerase-1